MNLYIFNRLGKAAVYGVGAYIRELTAALKNSDIHVCVVNLMSNRPHIQIEEIAGIRYWYFPEPARAPLTIDDQKLRELYHRNVVCLLQLYIKDKKNLIFHLNYNESGIFPEELKKTFDCRIISTNVYTFQDE